MATSFETIYDLFYKRVLNDPDFFSYLNVEDTEAEEIMKIKSLDYLKESISTILEYATPTIDFNDYDETTEEFAEDLTNQEIQMIVNLMFEKYLSRSISKINIYNKFFTTNEVSLFSPANDRKTFMDMFEYLVNKNIRAIRSYNCRDRLTNEVRTFGGVPY